MTYNETLEYIHSICWRGSRPGLSRIDELCRRLDNPEKELKYIHVAGTNGKGSVSQMLTQMLICDGYTVGTFTSPYVFSFRERMCVNGKMIMEEELADATEKVRREADKMEDPPTEFELICAVAFVYFLSKKCDIVVLEAGLGGRLDSTNIIKNPLLSVICTVALDHTDILGDTTEKIAYEKAGIIKSGCPVVAGNLDATAMKVVESTAKEKGADIYKVDYDKIKNKSFSLDGGTFDFDDLIKLKIKLCGTYQPENAAVAITCARVLKISEGAIRKGLNNAKWRARFEVVQRQSPTVIFDGGHNIEGSHGVAKTLTALDINKVVLLTAVMADKAYSSMASILAPFCSEVICVAPTSNERALHADKYAGEYTKLGVRADAYDDFSLGVKAAYETAKKKGIPLLATGSLYMYSEFIAALNQIK